MGENKRLRQHCDHAAGLLGQHCHVAPRRRLPARRPKRLPAHGQLRDNVHQPRTLPTATRQHGWSIPPAHCHNLCYPRAVYPPCDYCPMQDLTLRQPE